VRARTLIHWQVRSRGAEISRASRANHIIYTAFDLIPPRLWNHAERRGNLPRRARPMKGGELMTWHGSKLNLGNSVQLPSVLHSYWSRLAVIWAKNVPNSGRLLASPSLVLLNRPSHSANSQPSRGHASCNYCAILLDVFQHLDVCSVHSSPL
jgi:hypothetical protein